MQKPHSKNSTAMAGSAYTAFEAMFVEPDDNIARQEAELEYLKNQIRTVGVNIKRMCIDFVQEMFPPPNFVDTEERGSYELLAQNTDEADEMLKEKEGIGECNFEKEHCSSGQLLHSCSEELAEVEVSSSSSSARSFGNSHDSTEDVSDLGLSQKMKLGESCILIDVTEASESQEPGKLGPYEKISRDMLTLSRCNSRQDNEKHGSWYHTPASRPCCLQKDEAFEPWDKKSSDSDWETI